MTTDTINQSYTKINNERIRAHELIRALKGNDATGMCPCPAHEDDNPSLHVSDGNRDVVFKCHAGCSQSAVLDALKARGLWHQSKPRPAPRALPERAPEQDAAHKLRQALFVLRTAAGAIGNPRHWRRPKLRLLEPYFAGRGIDTVPKNALFLPAAAAGRLPCSVKNFPAMVMPIVGANGLQGAHVTFLRRDGTRNLKNKSEKNIRRIFGSSKGGWVQLGELNRDQPLLVAEGIENALSVRQLSGHAAIAAVSANNVITPPGCSKLIVCADNDETGQRWAEDQAQRLGERARIATPPDGCKDWNDAVTSDIDVADLHKIIGRAKKVKMREVQAVTAEAFLALNFPPQEYLMKPWLTTGSLGMLHANRGTLKTRLALSVARAVAMRSPLMAWTVEKAGKVLYVDGELPGALLQQYLEQLGPLDPNLKILSREQFHLQKELMPDLGTEDGRRALDQVIDAIDADVIILDSLSTLIRSGIENEAESWGPVQDWMLQHRWCGRTIMLVHHEGRSGKPRGSSKREDVLDFMIGLKPVRAKDSDPVSEDETRVELTFTKARAFFGYDAEPRIIAMSTKNGTVQWRHETSAQHSREQIATLHRKGWKQADIAKELDVTPSWVSQVVRELKREVEK